MNSQAKICILSFSNIAWDSRILREVNAAREQYQVDVIGFGNWQPPKGVRYFPVLKSTHSKPYLAAYLLSLGAGRIFSTAYEKFFWDKPEYRGALEVLLREKYDLIHANDWDALPVAVKAARQVKSKVLFDAHEYTVEQEADRPFWKQTVARYRDHFLRGYGDEASKMITVSSGVKDLYRQNYRWDMDLVLNIREYAPVKFHATNSEQIQIVHHGGAIPSRYIEDFVDLAGALPPRFHLNFILMPTNKSYYTKLKERAERIAPGRVTFWDPVTPAQIIQSLCNFDIGIPLMKVRQLSYFNSLPNKFFDYLIAGLAIAVSPLPSMQEIVERHRVGVIAGGQSWQSMAEKLSAMTAAEIDGFKRNSLELAKTLNAESEMRKLMQIYQNMLER